MEFVIIYFSPFCLPFIFLVMFFFGTSPWWLNAESHFPHARTPVTSPPLFFSFFSIYFWKKEKVKLAAPAVRQQPSEASGCAGAPAECLGVSPAGCLSEWKHQRGGRREGVVWRWGTKRGRQGGREGSRSDACVLRWQRSVCSLRLQWVRTGNDQNEACDSHGPSTPAQRGSRSGGAAEDSHRWPQQTHRRPSGRRAASFHHLRCYAGSKRRHGFSFFVYLVDAMWYDSSEGQRDAA